MYLLKERMDNNSKAKGVDLYEESWEEAQVKHKYRHELVGLTSFVLYIPWRQASNNKTVPQSTLSGQVQQ